MQKRECHGAGEVQRHQAHPPLRLEQIIVRRPQDQRQKKENAVDPRKLFEKTHRKRPRMLPGEIVEIVVAEDKDEQGRIDEKKYRPSLGSREAQRAGLLRFRRERSCCGSSGWIGHEIALERLIMLLNGRLSEGKNEGGELL